MCSRGRSENPFGAPGGNRTPDLDVRTVLLYSLSYEGDDPEFTVRTLPHRARPARYFSANSHVSHSKGPVEGTRVGMMENENMTDRRIEAREAATRLLNRLTAGLAFGAIAGVGILGTVSANMIPGTATTSGTTASTSTSSGSIASTSTGATSTGVQASPTPVSSASSSGVAVSGGS